MDVVGIGITCVDHIMEIDRLPLTDEFIDALGHSCQGGGRTATALSALGRLGAEAGLLSITGGDLYGRFCIEDLKYNGVDASHIIIDKDADTNYCVALAEKSTAGRSIIRQRGSCRRLTEDDLPEDYVRSAKILHLAGMDGISVKAAVTMKNNGGRVVMDADEYDPEIERNIGLIDVFIASKLYYDSLFGKSGDREENLRKILGRGPAAVVVTLGARGCIGLDRDGYFELPAFPVKVVDSNGAGDVFHGAFIYGMLRGWKSKDCARFASAVSAIKCTMPGGRAGIPDLETATRFMETGIINDDELKRRLEFYRHGLLHL